ncbi:MAG: FKBP-type peptidyl-prolyl cis-trans isomerase [Crocinitomicaceae bacterium]|nr:FKBP-type peptidyl-prolyl cis-trans isomerase [Crocinitomicaceae bacterium]
MKTILSLVLLVLCVSSCGTYSDEQMKEFDTKIQSYLKKNNIECLKSSSGLYYKIIEEGEGRKIQYTDVVSFKYSGRLLNGKLFDDRKDPVTFEVSKLIGCWKEIMLNLKPGGKAFLVSPPQLGYGTNNLDDIPKNSILVFEMEVVSVNEFEK